MPDYVAQFEEKPLELEEVQSGSPLPKYAVATSSDNAGYQATSVPDPGQKSDVVLIGASPVEDVEAILELVRPSIETPKDVTIHSRVQTPSPSNGRSYKKPPFHC